MIEKERGWKILISCPSVVNTYQKDKGKKYLVVNQKEITYQTENRVIHREIKNRTEIKNNELQIS